MTVKLDIQAADERDGHQYLMLQIRPEDMAAFRAKAPGIVGRPAYYTVHQRGRLKFEIEVFPESDDQTEAAGVSGARATS